MRARQGPFDQAVRQLTDDQGVDVVLEFVSNQETLPASYRSLKRAGRLAFVGYTPQLPLVVMPHELVRNEWEILGSRATTKQELQETMTLVAQGRITPVVDRLFPFEEVEAAFAALQQGHSLGRNVLAI
jgi:D-arabinose 1-dehydrogenase-like Zn-dependent alcohol dehydrogenase